MTIDPNALNTVLYALSTVAQKCPALAALMGALAAYRLQSMRDGVRLRCIGTVEWGVRSADRGSDREGLVIVRGGCR